MNLLVPEISPRKICMAFFITLLWHLAGVVVGPYQPKNQKNPEFSQKAWVQNLSFRRVFVIWGIAFFRRAMGSFGSISGE